MFTHLSSFRSGSIHLLVLAILIAGLGSPAQAQQRPAHNPAAATRGLPEIPSIEPPLMQLGVGDTVTITVFGQADLGATVYVSDDGTIPVALAGAVPVAGLSPSEASKRIEKALRDGRFVNDPHVTLTVTQSRSQRVSVLGEVASQGRYPIDSKTSIFDLLALAGGERETSAEVIYIVRTNVDGTKVRYPVNLKALRDATQAMPVQNLQGGDVILVPKAEQFYILGEVRSPNRYRIEPDMTVLQAITLAGGLTPAGSMRRIVVERHDAAGKTVTVGMKPGDPVLPNDVIRVKESIF